MILLSRHKLAEARLYSGLGYLRQRLLSASGSLSVSLGSIVVLALAIRLIVVVLVIHHLPTTTVNYNNFGWESWEMGWTARSIFLGQGFSSPFAPVTGSTALVPPLYPFLLAGIFKVFGLNTLRAAFAILTINSVCSALTCVPLYFLTRNALTQRMALIVSCAWAIYPLSIYFAADRVWDYAVTELLFTCCLMVAQKLHARGPVLWAGFGLLYGVTVLSNPSVVSLLPFLLLIAVYRVRRAGGSWLAKTLIASLIFLAVCAPWIIRNERVLHASFFLRDGFWMEFYAGNNGDTSESNSQWAHPASNPAEMKKYKSLGEIAYIADKHALSVDFVKHHRVFFAVASVRRIVRFWTGYWSFRPAYLRYEPLDVPNVMFCLFLVTFMLRGLARWWREDKGEALPFLLAVIVFPIPYYVTHSSMDYRQPLETIMVLLVSVGLFGTAPSKVSLTTDIWGSVGNARLPEDWKRTEASPERGMALDSPRASSPCWRGSR